ncbi:ABC transporter ATP-binding protein [Desulforhabdus amnigena]|jgi:lipoprotein-releasing system ATP-binding protein|uniref:Lipoprotein-releasing system ATP-binding protein LolD n=1 Tax=Desulforhabdus amnigena TaxID=40218 RepID=A0A9W6FW25_9BACT|nr:ABC transporter ATP-binding protein [Desulforhabdus amnigena]NLJ26788.1 ABC transporter ATP-binding protein [Deltaproteobacteria bacterium]GLI35951.1 lipoprotein-releasing system ATP-binding protein LolD [Desulforhabdus amnigena]
MNNLNHPVEVQTLGLTKVFGSGVHSIELFRDLDFVLRKGERIAIVGASGAGKSTLLHIIGTLEKPSSGKVLYGGKDIFLSDERELARFRNRHIGFVFQFHYLLPEFNALENVMMPGLIAGLPRGEIQSQSLALLERLGLSSRIRHRVGELSGGEQQRVAVARALLLRPSLFLADEPSGNLDSRTGRTLHELLVSLNEELGLTMVIVTHNVELASMMQRTFRLADGQLREE